jgi:hypothetical protein
MSSKPYKCRVERIGCHGAVLILNTECSDPFVRTREAKWVM